MPGNDINSKTDESQVLFENAMLLTTHESTINLLSNPSRGFCLWQGNDHHICVLGRTFHYVDEILPFRYAPCDKHLFRNVKKERVSVLKLYVDAPLFQYGLDLLIWA